MKAYKVYDRASNKFHLGGTRKDHLSSNKEGGKIWKRKSDLIQFLMRFLKFSDDGTRYLSDIPPDWDVIELELTRNGCVDAIDFVRVSAQKKIDERDRQLKEIRHAQMMAQAERIKRNESSELAEYKRLKAKFAEVEGYL